MIFGKTHKLVLGIGALSLALMVGGCNVNNDEDQTKQNTPSPIKQTSAADEDQLTDSIILRNPDQDNGETLRVLRKDTDNRVRQIRINYKDKRQGLIVKDASGKITDIKMVGVNQTVMHGVVGADGKSIVSGTLESANGTVIYKFDENGASAYQSDGKTLRFEQKKTSTGSMSFKSYSDDGKTVVGEEELNGATPDWMKLYDDAGKLTYDEKHSPSSAPTGWGGYSQTFNGTTYDAQGKATYRVTVQQSYYSQGGSVSQIDELGPDGVTVKSTIQPSPYGDTDYKVGSYASQKDLAAARSSLISKDTDATATRSNIQTQLNGLLQK